MSGAGRAQSTEDVHEPASERATVRSERAGSLRLAELANNSTRVMRQSALQHMADASVKGSLSTQLQARANRGHPASGQNVNGAALPEALKRGLESLSGYALDDVKVHYNSSRPALLQAHAYAQGTDIHLASGQEKHLPHEAWHVVQQKQGRVKPTNQRMGMAGINDDAGLEREADLMGRKAIEHGIAQGSVAEPPASAWKQPGTRHDGIAQRMTIKQPGYATGDMFGIAATLIDKDDSHVVIAKGPVAGEGHDPTDKADSIAKFYLDSRISADRVHVLDVPDVRKAGGTLSAEALRIERTILGNTKSTRQIQMNDVLSVSGGTSYVGKNFSVDMRGKIRDAWEVDASRDSEIKTWLDKKGVPTSGANVAVLWSRFSGKKGDIHLEHDSSYTGIEQIAVEAAYRHDAVIIAGDAGHDSGKKHKYDVLAHRINTKLGAGKVFNLTEFWLEDSPVLRAWGGNTRFGQFKLYDFLHRNFEEAKHLGFRSGNLEVMAMLGYQVRYMEEPGSHGGERMAAWHRHADGRTKDGGMAMGYERLQVSEPPTRSGKYLKITPTEVARPNWAPGRRSGAPKPEGIANLSKGFANRDLQAIMTYLTPAAGNGVLTPLAPAATTFMGIPEIALAVGNAMRFMGLPLTGAGLGEVDKAFRTLALRYHPDKEGGDHNKFILLNKAKSILKGDLSLVSGFNTTYRAIAHPAFGPALPQ